MADRNDFPDEYVEADRECRSAARGLGFVMVIALAFVASCCVARAAMAEEPRCTKDALKSAFAELWPAPKPWDEVPPWQTITPSCDCGCCDGGNYLTLEAHPWGYSTRDTCTDSAAYHECKAKAARERDAAAEAAEKARAEREARLNALARACELPGFEPPTEPKAEEWVKFELLDGNAEDSITWDIGGYRTCLPLNEGQQCCLEVDDAGALKCASGDDGSDAVTP